MKNILFTLFFLTFFACRPTRMTENTVLADACAWLWSQQSPDGGWHSTTVGLLKSGQSLTPFILWNLLETPDFIFSQNKEKVALGLDFLRKNVNSDGQMGMNDPEVFDYPNYATAHALRILGKYGAPEDSFLIKKMRNQLLFEQLAAHRGIKIENPAFGGWGFGEKLPYGEAGHVDLSHTRRVLQALVATGGLPEKTAENATDFINLVQKNGNPNRPNFPKNPPFDGGFYYSPVVAPANKGGKMAENAEFYASYATATCDGLLALLAAGYPTHHPHVQAAEQWLRAHPNWGFPEGIPMNDPSAWHRAMQIYHVAVRCEAFASMSAKKADFAPVLAVLLENRQQNGSFSNPDGLPSKENDPLLATALAVAALNFVVR
jgi:hypothetical protein